jgi:hypothetical protein
VRGTGGWDREEGDGGQTGEVAQTMYTHMNKYKNNLKKKIVLSAGHPGSDPHRD